MIFARILALILVGLVGLLSACGVLREADSPRARLFACHVRAFEPLVGDVFEAEQMVRDIYAGRVNLDAVFANLKATLAEIEDLEARVRSCNDEPEPPKVRRLELTAN